MRIRPCNVVTTLAMSLMGCVGGTERPVVDLADPTTEPASADSPLFPEDLGPSPELSRAVERGEARPAGPVTDERFRLWWRRAELLVVIESHNGHLRYLRELLKLSDKSEQEFLDRIGVEPLYTGESAAQQLKTFELVRRRVVRELARAEARLASVRHELAKLEPQSESTAATSSQSGDHVMKDQPITSLGLSATRVGRLEQHGIRTVGELARDFCLPEQHELLAELLEVDLASAKELLRKATNTIPAAELDALIQEAREPRAFGVLPPESPREGGRKP